MRTLSFVDEAEFRALQVILDQKHVTIYTTPLDDLVPTGMLKIVVEGGMGSDRQLPSELESWNKVQLVLALGRMSGLGLLETSGPIGIEDGRYLRTFTISEAGKEFILQATPATPAL